MHKFAVITASLLFLIASSLWAQPRGKVLLNLKNNASRVEAEFVSADEKGNLTVMIDGYRYIVPRNDYNMVIMSLPEVLKEARQMIDNARYGEAWKLLDKQLPYWDFPVLRCRVRLLKARAEIGLKHYQSAINTLLPLLKDSITDYPVEGEDYAEARLALALAQYESGKLEESKKNLKAVIDTGPPVQAIKACNKLGDYEIARSKFDQAALFFLRAVLYYDVSVPGRHYALQSLTKVLNESDDPSREFFANMLKQQYTASGQRQNNQEGRE